MAIHRLVGTAMFAAALALGAMGCANLSLFNSQHVHHEPDPNESGKVDALQRRVDKLEQQQAAPAIAEVKP